MIKIKTIIELFDDSQLENVIAGLSLKPEKIVFVGYKNMMSENRKQGLQHFFEMRGQAVEIAYEKVGRYDFDAIVNSLNSILDQNEECIFDLTGGKEMVLAAMGEVAVNRNVPVVQFDVKSGRMFAVKNCQDIQEPQRASMSIAECVALNGGVVVNDDNVFKWRLDSEFRKDIEIMWQICKENCARWNKQSVILEVFEHIGEIDKSLCVKVDLAKAKKVRSDVFLDDDVIKALVKNRLLVNYELSDDVLTFKYKNNQVYRCIKKAGSILELYAYMLLNDITAESPGFYDDIDVGVFLDWDGKLHDGTTAEVDTRNEVDLILMRDLIPVFVSCKNGEVYKEALYELNTVAERFGGKHTKKILLSTYICHDPDKRRYILQRARDMGIDVVDGVDRGDREHFIKVLKEKVK